MTGYWFCSPIGKITLQASSRGISRVDILPADADLPEQNSPEPLLKETADQLLAYLNGQRKSFDVPLDWSGLTEFQHLVLRRTLEIPFGEILRYGELARLINKPAASRAVGAALGSNPIPLIIPCHRVVAADGSLTGYSAAEGIKTKQWLLELEGHNIVGKKLD